MRPWDPRDTAKMHSLKWWYEHTRFQVRGLEFDARIVPYSRLFSFALALLQKQGRTYVQ